MSLTVDGFQSWEVGFLNFCGLDMMRVQISHISVLLRMVCRVWGGWICRVAGVSGVGEVDLSCGEPV